MQFNYYRFKINLFLFNCISKWVLFFFCFVFLDKFMPISLALKSRYVLISELVKCKLFKFYLARLCIDNMLFPFFYLLQVSEIIQLVCCFC
jgi:hypothetical protein